MNMNEQKVVAPKNLDDYLLNRLDQIYARGQHLSKIIKEFDLYQVDAPTRHRLILESDWGQDDKIRGAIELFGWQACLTESET